MSHANVPSRRPLPIVLAIGALCLLAACTSTPPTLDEWPHITLNDLVAAQGDSVTIGGAEHARALAVQLDVDATIHNLTVGGRTAAEGGPYFLDLRGHTLTIDGNLVVQEGYALVLRRGGEIQIGGDVTVAQGGSIVQEWTQGGTVQTTLTISGSFTNEGHIDLPGAIELQQPAGPAGSGTEEGRAPDAPPTFVIVDEHRENEAVAVFVPEEKLREHGVTAEQYEAALRQFFDEIVKFVADEIASLISESEVEARDEDHDEGLPWFGDLLDHSRVEVWHLNPDGTHEIVKVFPPKAGTAATPPTSRQGQAIGAGHLQTREPSWPRVELDNSVYQPPYLGNAWLEAMGVDATTGGRDITFTWTDGTPVRVAFPFRIHVRSLDGAWELDCEATYRTGYGGFLVLGGLDANRGSIPRVAGAQIAQAEIGVNTCFLEPLGEVEVIIPGTPVIVRGPAEVLVGTGEPGFPAGRFYPREK